MVDGEVRQGLAELLRALFGTNAALVAEYTLVTSESEKVDCARVGGWADFDNVVPAVAFGTVERVVASLPRLFGWFYKHVLLPWVVCDPQPTPNPSLCPLYGLGGGSNKRPVTGVLELPQPSERF